MLMADNIESIKRNKRRSTFFKENTINLHNRVTFENFNILPNSERQWLTVIGVRCVSLRVMCGGL